MMMELTMTGIDEDRLKWQTPGQRIMMEVTKGRIDE
jgi:hypothetical protein